MKELELKLESMILEGEIEMAGLLSVYDNDSTDSETMCTERAYKPIRGFKNLRDCQ